MTIKNFLGDEEIRDTNMKSDYLHKGYWETKINKSTRGNEFITGMIVGAFSVLIVIMMYKLI